MAIDANVDPMAFLEEAMKPQPRANGDFQPWPWKGPDKFQKALIHPLLNIMQGNSILLVDIYKHEYYDNSTKTWVYRNVCVEGVDGLECAICAKVATMPETTKEEKSLKYKMTRSRRFLLPIYLHLLATDVDGKPSEYITYKDKDGKEHPVNGLRILEMKPDAEIFSTLYKSFNFPGSAHDITQLDFKVVGFPGNNGFLERKTEAQAPSPQFVVPTDIDSRYLNKESVREMYLEMCPPVVIGVNPDPAVSSPPAQSSSPANGAVKAAPDF